MTTNDRFGRAMTDWLHDDAAGHVADHLDEVLAMSAATRQRPAWSSLERWLPVDTTFRPRLFPTPRLSRALLVAALILGLLAAMLIYAGSHQPKLPAPFGPADNGIFVTSRDGDLYIVDPSTATSSPLVTGEGFDFSPIFSRDGTRFLFLRSDGRPPSAPGTVATLTMWVANPDGSNAHAVTPPTESLDWMDWSPDGSRIAYMTKGELWVANASGGQPLHLTWANHVGGPTWLPPVGREILYRWDAPFPKIMAIRPDGGDPRQVSVTPPNSQFDYGSLTVSPDGKIVAFTRWFTGVPDRGAHGWWPRVYALDIETGRETAFPTAGATGQRGPVAFSPDGKLVAYARIDRGGTFQIVTANADGTGNEQAFGALRVGPSDGSSVDATWNFTPDGKALLVRYGTDDQGMTHLLPLDGSPESTLLDTGGFEFIDVQRLAH